MAQQFGYADFDRVQSWDGPGLDNTTHAIPANGSSATGVLDVSRYSYVAGEIFSAFAVCYVKMQWFLDPAATVSAGSFKTAINPGVGIGAVLHVPCLGPFLVVTFYDVSGAFNTVDSVLFATNRGGWSPFNMPPATYIEQGYGPIGAGSTVYNEATVSIAGDCTVNYIGDLVGSFGVQFLSIDGTWHNLWSLGVNTNQNWQSQKLTLPGSPIRCVVQNPGAGSQNMGINLTTNGGAFP